MRKQPACRRRELARRTTPITVSTLPSKPTISSRQLQRKRQPVVLRTVVSQHAFAVKRRFRQTCCEGRIKINDLLKLWVVLPQQDPSIQDREGIVEFIDQDNPVLNQTVQ
jgi:hypothetical protein